jgi:outer membrane immunogenic protein
MTNWAGIYIGVNGGGGWGDTQWTFPTVQFFTPTAGANFNTRPDGAIVGGQIGYNQQRGSWVWGVEITGDWANLRQSLIGPLTPTYPFDNYTTKLTNLETFTVRVGYAPGNWLYYAKGGAAGGSIQFGALSGLPIPGITFSTTQYRPGGTVGAGIEYMWTPHLILGAEYDAVFLDSGSFATTGVCTTAATCAASNGATVAASGGTFTVQSVVGRVSYKF